MSPAGLAQALIGLFSLWPPARRPKRLWHPHASDAERLAEDGRRLGWGIGPWRGE